ncbi:phosphoglycerate kinase [Patescibacteria group bacterium]
MKKKTIKDISLEGKKVLVRVDYNVSLSDDFKIADDFRIRQTIPTINYLLKNDCTIFLTSHLGRPDGMRNKKYSLAPVAKHLQKILGKTVNFYEKDISTGYGRKGLEKFKNGQIVLLENIRFYKREEENSREFSKKLSLLAEVYVNDAFGVSHRAHASTAGVTEFMPGVAGLLLEKEVDIISQALDKPKRPLVAIIGGAKAEDKITLVGKLLEKADYCIVGGGTANTFLKAWGYKVGKSKVCYEMVELAKQLFWKASRGNTALLLPTDVVLGNLETGKVNGVVAADKIDGNWQALDIGPKTKAEFGNVIAKAKTIIWNGPMGIFEKKEYRNGTDFIYYSIVQNPQSLSIVGGGDTISALPKKEYLKVIDHVSTGGGAMLEFIEKGTLAGIEALDNK